ncbi:MAG TPA: PSD1 and planctomycete cytochrome C domain-containing protein [Blastocatellia bacterium]|nr:PSD1 and planctomycete cytochrome C domain-containing protein [Blastocatellia bacterium]
MWKNRGKLLLCLFCLGAASAPFFGGSAASQTIDFARDIRPIFEAACYKCHGSKIARGQLRLDNRKSALEGGISGAVINPGEAGKSLLLRRILGEDGEARMPMGGAPLRPEQIEMIRKWIDQGAEWPEGESERARAGESERRIQKHWAYIKPVRSEPPVVKNAAWARNPIDRFILARLEKEGLAPSPEAAKETLIRRVYLDLTGLPPSPKEVDQFLADSSPNAYEKLVDRLLASPHFGERWARPWLDLARYADSNGYERDTPRMMWKYRDWVINALNQDMPFDQFTVEQIAGDMLPNATIDQKIATGFHRNTMLNQEAGVDDEEARWETLIDRVNTTGTVWLGATIGCAQCHNHKYDPFTQKEYYKLLAFFDNYEYAIYQQPGNEGWVVEPEIETPAPEQAARRARLQAEIKSLEERLKTVTPALAAAMEEWERKFSEAQADWIALDTSEISADNGTTLTKLEDRSILATGANPGMETYTVVAKANLRGVTGVRLEALPHEKLPRGGPGRDIYGNFILNRFEVEVSPAGSPSETRKLKFREANADEYLDAYRGTSAPTYFAPANLLDETNEVGWGVDALKRDERLGYQLVLNLEKPLMMEGETLLKVRLKFGSEFSRRQSIGRFRLSVTSAQVPAFVAGLPAELRPILVVPPARRNAAQKAALTKEFLATTPLLEAERDRLAKLQVEINAIRIEKALVMRERASFERPSTYLRARGSYTNIGEKVYADTPAVLPPLPAERMPNRLGLAYWLVDEENPLSSRVTVNRFWEQIFGRGLVETSEDFGTQGERPSHPELLDWLAVRFRDGETERRRDGETGGRGDSETERPISRISPISTISPRPWNMKSLLRLIVTSATYRQSSKVTPALRERDPYNRLLSRGPRFRVEAEMVRDIGLAASGLLNRAVGGPSVNPSPIGRPEDRYRRGVYTAIRRTTPPPSMTSFDAPSREFCAVRRLRTNTPLQALTTLNDPVFFDFARGLAKRVLAEAGPGLRERLTYGFRLCMARRPNEKEIEALEALYQRQLARFTKDVEAARTLSNDADKKTNLAELAALTVVSNTLLSLDETLTKE